MTTREPGAPAPGPRPPAFVALVDDHRATLEALRDLLEVIEIECVAFSSAEDFLGYPERDRVSCLVLDIDLPGMSGLELQQRLATAGDRTPIIFLTSTDDARVRDRALAAGARCFLVKPVEGSRLVAWLDELA